MLHLELAGTGPVNQRLARALQRAVLEGRLAPGHRLPPTRELARTLGVSRGTVVDAYEQLAAEGFVHGRVGAGTFVALRAGAPASVPSRAASAAPLHLSAWGRRVQSGAAHRPSPLRRRPLRWNLEYGAPLALPALHVAWRRALARAADRADPDYPPSHGHPALRAAVAGYLARRRGIVADPEDVLVVSGTQQAVALAAHLLVDPGSPAVVEEPCYQGTRHVLRALGARLVALPVDDDGLLTARLPAGGARLAVVTPSHQFPLGAVLSLQRRLELLAWARRHAAWIVEDDYDGEFRHDGRPLAALKSLDDAGRVIHVGSFSKVAFPALRLGYVVVPPALREAFRAAKWLADRGAPPVTQQALAELIDSGRFERLLRRSGRLLLERREALIEGLARHCGGALEVAGAAAGMHLTAWLRDVPPGAVPALVEQAQRVQVGLYPVAPYYARAPRRAGLLLGYAGLGPRDLGEAARRLGALLASFTPARGRVRAQ
jgi:GntR family transcriptional regulator/MocR family aminotransferase